MRHRQQARIFHEGLVVDQLQDAARGRGLLRQGGCRTLLRWDPASPGSPSAEAAEGRRERQTGPAPRSGVHSGASGTPGAAPRPAWQSHTRGDACTSAQTRWQNPGTSTGHSPHGWGYRPLGCPPEPSVPPPAAPPRPRRQCGGGVNATLRRRQGSFGATAARTASWKLSGYRTRRARHRPSCLSECPWLSYARFLVALKGAAQAVTRAGLGLGYHGYHRRWCAGGTPSAISLCGRR